MKNLIKFRKQNKFTQQDVANKLGIACNTYCQYETGARQPNIKALKMLSKLFDVPIDDLLK